MRILLVDDEQLLLASIPRGLRAIRPDWEVTTAIDGAEALRILETESVDILVTDIQMPVMDGMSLLAKIRENPVLSHIPLIFISADSERTSMRLGMSSGADDYLTKPFSIKELTQAIEGRLRRLMQGTILPEDAHPLRLRLAQILTDRELEILALIGRGMVTKDIARHLDLSPKTVSVHRANIMRKLDLHNAAALAALAISSRVS